MLHVAGKTVVLLLEGLRVLRRGGDVHVVSWEDDALAASLMLAEQLRLALGDAPPSQTHTPGNIVHHHVKDIRDRSEVARVVAAIRAQAAACTTDTLVILDEANFSVYERLVLSHLDLGTLMVWLEWWPN